MSDSATVVEIREQDIAPVAAFLVKQVGATEAVPSRPLPLDQRLRWLLLENPAREDGIPFGWWIRDASGNVAGTAVCAPFRIATEGLRCTGLMFSKFFVDPACRSMGLGLLMRFVRLGDKFPLFVTSTNAPAGELFKRVGATQIRGMDHTMLAVARPAPLVREWAYRKTTSSALAALVSIPAALAPGKISKLLRSASLGQLSRINSADELQTMQFLPPSEMVAVERSMEYLRWRYLSADPDKDVYHFTFAGEADRLVVVNGVRAGYRRQIRVLNVLDVWPPASAHSAPALAAALAREYRRRFDVIWLRSQPTAAEEALRQAGLIPHAFPAPLGWYLDKANRLSGRQWYLMPGESE